MVNGYQLLSGETIIGIEEESSLLGLTYILLKNPVQILLQQVDNDRMGMSFSQYLPYTEKDSVRVYKSAIVAEFTPSLKIENEYNRVFGSGIQIVETKF